LRRLLSESSLTAPLRRVWAGLGTCLMYHRLCTDDFIPEGRFWPNRELVVREGEFDRQMAYLARNHNCLSLPDAVRLLRSGRLPKRSVIVTFDDGYLDNLTLALPILKAHGVPATIYITTGMVENTTTPWWYELEQIIRRQDHLEFEWNGRPRSEKIIDSRRKRDCYERINRMMKSMNPADQRRLLERLSNDAGRRLQGGWEVLDRGQVRHLAKEPLITIGAHTHRHPVLSSLPPGQLRVELQGSRRLLEEWTGTPVTHLAYPFGGRQQAGSREFHAAEELGFESATTTRLGHLHAFHARRLFTLPRIAIGHDDTMTRFRWKLSGLECVVRRPFSPLAA
jgi:peptidoglycan/xylan/chitin deacetylase (PgdA/CDA1 family)